MDFHNFSYTAPTFWNKLPYCIRQAPLVNVAAFKVGYSKKYKINLLLYCIKSQNKYIHQDGKGELQRN